MERLRTVFLDAARSPKFRELVEGQGATYRLDVGPEMDAAVRAEYAALGEVARDTGLTRSTRP